MTEQPPIAMDRLARLRGEFFPLLKRTTILGLAFGIVACASKDVATPVVYEESQAERLFGTGYDDILNIYIDEVALADLVSSGLDGLSEIDPGFSTSRQDGRLVLRYEDKNTSIFEMPIEGDAEAWGQVTARSISAATASSPALAETPPERIYEAVFDGVLSELDGYSRYSGFMEARENRASRDGFGGIGVRIRLIEEGVLILSVMEETPAAAVDLRADDIIVAIDGVEVAGLSQRDAIGRLRGPLHSRVVLTLERIEDEKSHTVSKAVTRSHIIPQTVAYHTEGNAAYLQVSGFNQNTTRSLEKKINQAHADLGDDLGGYIVDLRGNPGGLLDQAVAISDLFISSGRIVTTRGRHPDSHQYFEAAEGDIGEDAPVVVLLNGGSASASEIVAGALQDSRRAVVVGSVSYGKGTVQTLLGLPNQGELTLTWARFHAPSGYALNRRGVLPDICTSGKQVDAAELIEEMRSGSGLVDPHLRGLNISSGDDASVEELRASCPSHEGTPDLDIEMAKRILSEPALFARVQEGAPSTADLQASNFQD